MELTSKTAKNSVHVQDYLFYTENYESGEINFDLCNLRAKLIFAHTRTSFFLPQADLQTYMYITSRVKIKLHYLYALVLVKGVHGL
jgi:hypothetical protein